MAYAEKIKNIFLSKVPDDEDAFEDLTECWIHRRKLKRNDFLISKGETETELFFIIDGSLRIYFPHGDEEICVGFAHPGNLICSYPSFIKQKPSDYFIQALVPCETVSIRRGDFFSLMDKHRSIERAWRLLEEEALLGKIERETEMLTFSPEERYNRLMERSPHVFRTIPRKYIASYLRMSPETLSRIRPS